MQVLNEQRDERWNIIWDLDIPPKIKLPLWRACKECLPIRLNLCKRGMPITDTCVLYGATAKRTPHLFTKYGYAKACWTQANQLRSLDDHPMFKDWLFQRLETSDDASKQKIAAVLWGIWSRQNGQLWRGDNSPLHQCVNKSVSYITKWREANRKGASVEQGGKQSKVQSRWIHPTGISEV